MSDTYIRKRCFKHFEEVGFKKEISEIKWFDVYNTSDVDTAERLLTERITRVLDKFAPVKTIQVKPSYAPWLTDQVKEAMTQRDRAQLSWRLYRHLRNFQPNA